LIAHVKGTVARKGPDSVVVDVHGVGYLVNVPTGSAVSLPAEGDTVLLHTTMAVRADDISLYGFASLIELELFQMAMGVTGVGPRVALGLLGALGADAFVAAVASNDVRTIMRAPGVGQKLAQRIVLELGEKVAQLAFERRVEAAAGQAGAGRTEALDDVVGALMNWGYSRSDARRAAERAFSSSDAGADVAAVVRHALQLLSGEGR